MSNDVKYIAESDTFIVDGRVIKGSDLTASEKSVLLERVGNRNYRMLTEVPVSDQSSQIL